MVKVKELYDMIGDYNDAIKRMMNESLIEALVVEFNTDTSYQLLKTSIANGNREDAFRAAHTLKGVAANLSLSKVQQVATELTEQLRSLENDADPELVAKLDEVYELTYNAIEEYMSGQ